MERAHLSAKTYVIIWAALVCLTLVSFLLSRLPLGGAELVPALVIAAIKSTLVALFFMHLMESRFTNAAALLVAIAMVVLLVTLTSVDVGSRRTFPRAPQPIERSE